MVSGLNSLIRDYSKSLRPKIDTIKRPCATEKGLSFCLGEGLTLTFVHSEV